MSLGALAAEAIPTRTLKPETCNPKLATGRLKGVPMSDYKKLKVWEDAHQFTVDIYNTTQKFPNNEQYGLTSQIRRSASSIPTNIVEGSGQLTRSNYIRFLGMAQGSAYEVEYQILLAKDLGYLELDKFNLLNKKIKDIICMLFGLIKSLKNS